MNTSGEVADLMVKESIQITESAVKLAGLGAKNLAALLIALSQDNQKTQGKTNIQKLIKEGKQLCIMQVKRDDLSKFNGEAKKYGVLYASIVDKTSNSGLVDVIAKQEDIGRLNYIMEKMGCPIPTNDDIEMENEEPIKNAKARVSEAREQDSSSMMHGSGSDKMQNNGKMNIDKKPSIKEKISKYKNQIKSKKKNAPEKDRTLWIWR